MGRKGPQTLLRAVSRLYPDLEDPGQAIESGAVSVDGRVLRNPASVVGRGSNIALVAHTPLRGEAKLRPALDTFGFSVEGRVALDVGAAAGGFTRVLLEAGAVKVYAVDAGHGQLLGSLSQDSRVVNLEATNLAGLNRSVVPDAIDVFTLDLSYLSLADAVPQLDRIGIAANADLIALVKPMFELHLSRPPDDRPSLDRALAEAIAGIETAGWRVVNSMESPVLGGRGAFEFLVHARRPA